ncbi:MAG TPA: protein-disulfide reductase DsbD domain-containing protein [Candidatus Limnocylindrales bacterium]|nr:protein-disulfide reductase DsbD domain-containing protein [Candidatus Limnocylindrales bacterium]
MRLIFKVLFTLVIGLAGFSAQAAHTQARLILGNEVARPGDIVLAGVQLQMDPRWHTYWKNSGESGMPTTITWQLPPGITAGPIQWPIPEKLLEQELTTYILTDKVVLLVPLTLSSNLRPGTLDIKAKVDWLECEVQCIPGKANVQASLKIDNQQVEGKEAKLLTDSQKKLPRNGDTMAAQARWDSPPAGDTRALAIGWNSTNAVNEPDFFPDNSDDFEMSGQTERLPADAGKVWIRKQIKKTPADWPKVISGLIVQRSGSSVEGYQVKIPINSGASTSGTSPTAQTAAVVPLPGLGKMLLYAFIGGLILNVMPCVLPVIALKILGFVGQAKQDPRRARLLGLIYAGGVLVSFLALALIVLGIKAAGHKAGWGLQFGNAYFLVVMTTLATLIALNLFGVFEVSLGGKTMDAAANLSSKHGAAGAFFNGLLATVLATSCTAPFLGAAIGFAFAPSQTAIVTLLVFLTIGIGLALPYVVLTWQPGWLKFLPKPGVWMERFKIAMGFPMLAAAVWLFSLTALHYGERSWWLILFLVIVAVAAWTFGEFIQRDGSRRTLATAAIIVLLLGGYLIVLEGHLRWRQPMTQGGNTTSVANEPGGIPWHPWSPEAVAQARSEHRPVVVDFTAKWCLTCNTIVKPALESSSVRRKLQELNAVALLGDYTTFPDNITEELNRFGRAGVPLVLVYPVNPSEPPMVLPEALTSGTILNALTRAVR